MLKKILPICLVILIAAFLRFYNLDKIPPALFGDEIDVGYQAYSILHTGKDIRGHFLPIYIQSIAEFRAPLYIYSTVPFVAVFGLNEWGVRLPAAFWGVLSVFGLYLLTKQLFNQRIALFAAFSIAISPWSLQYSRASFEVTLLISLLVFATYFFLLGDKRHRFWILSAFLFGLTFYTYSTATIFTPLLGLILVFLHRERLMADKKVAIISLLVLFVTLLPISWMIIRGEARQRFGLVSIFQDTVLLDKINIARKGETYFTPEGDIKTINPREEAFFHNKPTIFAQVFALNYFRAYSLDFLFADGDPNFRQSIHEMGMLYAFELPLVLLGAWFLLTRGEVKNKKIVFSWLLFAPIPAALTFDGGYHATRLFLMLPALAILDGLGILYLTTLWQKKFYKLPILLLAVVAVFNVIFYLHRYYVHYPIESWRWWQIGFKETMTFIGDNGSKYQTVVINNSYEPALERYLFYTKYDPALFQRQYSGDKISADIIPGIQGFTLNGSTYFGMLSDDTQKNGGFEKVMKPGMLYLASARDEVGLARLDPGSHQHFNVIKTIVNPLGDPIFYLLEGK